MSSDIDTPTTVGGMLSAAQMREISDFDSALLALRDTYGVEQIDNAADALGDGFAMTDNKDQFCGVRMLIVHFTIKPGDFAGEDGVVQNYATVSVVTRAGKFRFTDGSQGVRKQLEEYLAATGRTFLAAEKGLRRSDYTTTVDGKETKATTYYIDTSRDA